MRTFIIVALFFLSSACYGQYCSATLLYKDGSKKEGFVRLKSLSNYKSKGIEDHAFTFKNSEGDKSEIFSNSIKYLVLTDKKEKKHILEFMETVYEDDKRSKGEGPFWHQLLKAGELCLYTSGDYTIEGGKLKTYAFNFTFPVKRLSEEKGTILKYSPYYSKVIGKDHIFMANGSDYFKDYPELATKIKNRELKFEDIYEIVDMYNEWKEKSQQTP